MDTRTCIRSLSMLGLGLALWASPGEAERRSFTGTGTGSIPDGPSGCAAYGAPRDVSFSVSGLVAPIGSVRVTVSFSPVHTWAGDLDVVLFAPNGDSHVLFSRVGAVIPAGSGDSSDLAGPYAFVDHFDIGPGDLWAVALATGGAASIPAARYRTSSTGEGAFSGEQTLMNPAFTDLTTAQINGTWILRFRDHCMSDTGTVSAAQLSISNPVVLDFDGDGATDLVVVRNTGGGPMGAITWIASVPPSPMIFRDGFESGNFVAWSASFP